MRGEASARCGIVERVTCREPCVRAGVEGPESAHEKQRTNSLTGVHDPPGRSDHMHTLLKHYAPLRNKDLDRNDDTPTIPGPSEKAV